MPLHLKLESFMIILKETLVHYKIVERLFVPCEPLFEEETKKAKINPISLKKEKTGQVIKVEFNKKSFIIVCIY